MTPIKISDARIQQILQSFPYVRDTELISKDAKRLLATILNYYLTIKKVQEYRYFFITDKDMRASVGIKYESFIAAREELKDYDLITVEHGKVRTDGQKAQATRYYVNITNLYKPVKFKPLDADFENVFRVFSEPLQVTDNQQGAVDIEYSNRYSNNIDLENSNKNNVRMNVDLDKDINVRMNVTELKVSSGKVTFNEDELPF